MNQNPYDAPRAYGPPEYAQSRTAQASNRTLFVLAAVGAWLASLYWGALTLLILLSVTLGSRTSPVQLILPAVLVVLYAVRGFQIVKGDFMAARRIVVLHGIGALAAIMYMTRAHGLFAALQAGKLVIHVFGGVTAYLAVRSASAPGRA